MARGLGESNRDGYPLEPQSFLTKLQPLACLDQHTIGKNLNSLAEGESPILFYPQIFW